MADTKPFPSALFLGWCDTRPLHAVAAYDAADDRVFVITAYEPDALQDQREIVKELKDDKCPLCGGKTKPGITTFTADLGFGMVVVRHVPATVCSQCGADWISDDVAERIEALVEDARKKRLQVEVTSLP